MKKSKHITQYFENDFNIIAIITDTGIVIEKSKVSKRRIKSKYFTQYKGENFSIGIIIGIYGNILNMNKFYSYNDKEKERGHIHYKNNITKCRSKCKEWRDNNIEYNKLRTKKWRDENPDLVKKWRENNKDKISETWAKQNALRRGWKIPKPINKYFDGSHQHHTHRNGDHQETIFIPIELHKSIIHAHNRPETMNKINKIAFEWLERQ